MNKKKAFIIVIVFLVIVTLFGIFSTIKNISKPDKLLQAEKTVEKKDSFVGSAINNVSDLKVDRKSESKPNVIESLTLKTGTKDRTYLLEKPADNGTVKNIVIALHGSGGNGESIQKNLRINELVTNNQTIIAYPNALNESWNDTRVKSEDVDDIGFITELIQSLQASYNIGLDNTTLIGVSNGGFMIQTIVCQNDTLAKNMVSITASLLVEIAEQCKSFPANLIFILGKKDNLVPYDGGNLSTPIPGNVLSAQNTLTNTAEINKCGEKSEEKESTAVLVQKITDCPNGGQVSLITYVNETHISLPLKVDFVSIIKENGIIK
jgi:polyhydroxybutyrate depolymerase